jgi:phosphoglycolate phosphatase-like HAD superfamily hydrolase
MHVFLFDIDGTLLASGGAGKAAFEEAFVAEFAPCGIRHQVPMAGRTDRAIAGDFFRTHGIPDTPEHWSRFRAAYLTRLPASLAARQGRVIPGVLTFLSRLAECDDVAVGLLTGNLEAGARIKLAHHGLAHRFSFGAFGDEHLDRNAVAGEAWQIVRKRFGARVVPERLWVVGDTPLDVRCARAIGAKSLAVATGSHSRDELAADAPDLLLGDLTDAGAAFPFLQAS